jgi:hypothetical protein
MGNEREVYTVLVLKAEERDHSEDRSVDGRMGLEFMLGRLAWAVEWIQLS